MALGRESGNQQRSSRRRRIPRVQESDVKEGTSLRFNTKHLRCSHLTPPQSNTNKGQHYAGSNRHSNPKPPVPGSFGIAVSIGTCVVLALVGITLRRREM